MAISFSPQQRHAIETTGANLLVSAAAGAGKTAVLVARILHLLSESRGEFDLQNLLVVTFTRAAAREMKDRIGEAIRRRLEENPGDAFFLRQLALLDRAPISTLDSFCQEVARENFHSLGINPGFSVLDADEADLLWREIMDGIFENHYSDTTSRGSEFRQLVDAYGGRREDQNLIAEVRRVADFLRTTADPNRWKTATFEALEPFEEKAGRAINPAETRWGAAFRDSLLQRLDGVCDRLDLASRSLRRHGIDEAKLSLYIDAMREAAESAREALASGNLDGWAESLGGVVATRMPTVPRTMDDEAKEYRAGIKERLLTPAKDELKGLVEFEGRYTAAQWVAGVRATVPLVRRLFLLTDEVLAAFDAEKRRQGTLDFSDLERLALTALQADSADPLRPGPVAERYRGRFEHVLVDEYQDINELQDALLRLVSRQDDTRGRAPNLFAVGDVKQSIYGFRLADPDIFIKSYMRYRPLAERPSAAAPGSYRIDLPTNYRCRPPVVESVNAVFARLMAEDLGGIPYDEPARLVCGRVVPEPPVGLPPYADPDGASTELVLAEEQSSGGNDNGGDGSNGGNGGAEDSTNASDESGRTDAQGGGAQEAESISGAEREARALAARLWEIVGRRGDGTDAALWVHAEHPDHPLRGAYFRPARWSDIVILLRAVSGRAELFFETLRQCGVPLVAPPAGGLLDTLEVRDVLSVLQVLDNPCQDIPLAAHLRSPLCRFPDDALARIRLFSEEGDFFSAVGRYGNDGPDGELRAVCAAAMGRIVRWREIARQSTVADLLDHILEETGYRESMRGLPEGRRRQANLDALRARAAQFDSFARRGLARFLRFLKGLADAGVDPSTGVALSPGENAVRAMSVHKSKGLEFPIVCVADLGHRFNRQDLYRAVVTDREWLIGMKTPAGRRSITLPSLSHEVVKEQRRRAMLAEELRLLYVAMTRAREHLILSASVKKAAEKLEGWGLWAGDGPAALPQFLRLGAGSHLDWIGPAVAGAAGMGGPFVVRLADGDAAPVTVAVEGEATGADASPKPAGQSDREEEFPPWQGEAKAALDRVLAPPPVHLPTGLRAKLSVTEIKRMWDYGHEPEDGDPTSVIGSAELSDVGLENGGGIGVEGEDPNAIAANGRAGGSGGKKRQGRYSVETMHTQSTIEALAGFGEKGMDGASGLSRESGANRGPDSPKAAALSPTDRGTLTHLVLQHLDFQDCDSADAIARQIDRLEALGVVPTGIREVVDLGALDWMFQSPLGIGLRANAEWVRRELPFTALLPAGEVYRSLPETTRIGLAGESIVVQGVIDCLVVEPDALRVYDYKTDSVFGDAVDERAAGYGAQLRLYARAASEIFNRPVVEAALIFLQPREIREVKLD